MCYFENRSNTEKIPKPIQQPHRKETEEMSIDRIQHVETIDTIEEVTKFNPYHGADGRFASAGGGGAAIAGGATSAAGAGDASSRVEEIVRGGSYSPTTVARELGIKEKEAMTLIKQAQKKVGEKDGTTLGMEPGDSRVLNKDNMREQDWNNALNNAGKGSTIKTKAGAVYEKKANGNWEGEDKGFYSGKKGPMTTNIDGVKAKGIEEFKYVKKSYDTIEHVEKANPYHGRDGRFTTAGGRGAGATTAAGAGSGKINDKYFKPVSPGHPFVDKMKRTVPAGQLSEMSRGFEMAEKDPQKRVRIDMGSHDVYIQRATNADVYNMSIRGKNGNNDLPSSRGTSSSKLGYETLQAYKTISENYGAPKNVKAYQQKANGRNGFGNVKWIDE